jgi:hypothetical protein
MRIHSDVQRLVCLLSGFITSFGLPNFIRVHKRFHHTCLKLFVKIRPGPLGVAAKLFLFVFLKNNLRLSAASADKTLLL